MKNILWTALYQGNQQSEMKKILKNHLSKWSQVEIENMNSPTSFETWRNISKLTSGSPPDPAIKTWPGKKKNLQTEQLF